MRQSPCLAPFSVLQEAPPPTVIDGGGLVMLWEGWVWEEPCGGPPHFFDRTDLRRCTRSAPVAPLFRDRHRTGGLDQLAGSGRGSVVEESLGCGRQGLAGLGHQHEGTLNGVAAVQNGGFCAGHAAYGGIWILKRLRRLRRH